MKFILTSSVEFLTPSVEFLTPSVDFVCMALPQTPATIILLGQHSSPLFGILGASINVMFSLPPFMDLLLP